MSFESWMNININSAHNCHRHCSVTMGDLLTPRRHGHGSNSNVFSLRHSWSIECNVIDVEAVFVAREWNNCMWPKEEVLDDDLGEDHVGLCILYCLDDILVIMNIWRWPLSFFTSIFWKLFSNHIMIHEKKSCPFPPAHIATIVQCDYISITFGHLKFASGLLH
jgi:hypothetical protein